MGLYKKAKKASTRVVMSCNIQLKQPKLERKEINWIILIYVITSCSSLFCTSWCFHILGLSQTCLSDFVRREKIINSSWHCLEQELWLGSFQSSLPTSVMLWFCSFHHQFGCLYIEPSGRSPSRHTVTLGAQAASCQLCTYPAVDLSSAGASTCPRYAGLPAQVLRRPCGISKMEVWEPNQAEQDELKRLRSIHKSWGGIRGMTKLGLLIGKPSCLERLQLKDQDFCIRYLLYFNPNYSQTI